MGLSLEERERRLAERERAVAANEAEARQLLAEAEQERNRAHKLGEQIARKLHHALTTARAQLDSERAAFDARLAQFNHLQSEFHSASAVDRDRQRAAWADLAARQKRLTAEFDETNRFHAEQSAALDARAAELAAREQAQANTKTRLQREVSALREEVAALDARARNTRQLVDELEQRRAELRAAALATPAPGAESHELHVALDRAADRDLGAWVAELTAREEKLNLDRAALQSLSVAVSADKATLADRRRVLAEQFAQLATAKAQWQEAERATIAELEQLAQTLRRQETELDARAARLTRADARRREDGYELWQLRLRLEAWQSKLIAYEMQWYTEREQAEVDLARRESDLAAATEANPLPFALPGTDAVPAELTTLREELERMAAVLLETELPEPPDPPESELPWGAEDTPGASDEPDDAHVLLFDAPARAA